MTSQTSGRMGHTRALLLGAMVVLGTIAIILSFGSSDGAEETEITQEAPEDAVVELSPMVPASAMTSASWRDGSNPRQAAADAEAADADFGESTSMLDGVEFGDEGDKRRRYEKSVEKTVSEIEGLGVYIAPETDVDEPKKKKR